MGTKDNDIVNKIKDMDWHIDPLPLPQEDKVFQSVLKSYNEAIISIFAVPNELFFSPGVEVKRERDGNGHQKRG